MSAPRPRRRQKIVDAKFQLQLGFNLVGYIYLYVLLFAFVANAQAMSALYFADADDPAFVEAVTALRSFGRFVLVPLVVTFVITAFHALLITHRIAGPVHRTKMVLRQMAQRRPPQELRFRDKDFLHDLGSEFTVTLAALREDQARVRRMNEETAVAARSLLVGAQAGVPTDQLESLAHAVLDATDRLDRHVAPPSDGDELDELDRLPVPSGEVREPVAALDA